MSTLYLFADTNFFLHYKPLSEIDWSAYRDFDQVEIVVCRTVQREIDRLKGGRDGRRNRRARKTASEFLEIAQHGPKEQKAVDPCVVLRLYDKTRPKQDFADTLDYDQSDDQIIGYLALFRDDNPWVDARLLTRDSGPILTASNLGIPCEVLDENWLLPPETDDRDREIRELQKQVVEFQAQEPRFQIHCDRQESNRPDHAKVPYNVFCPLDPEERDLLLNRLQVLYPPTVVRSHGVPASAIKKYEEEEYPEWITKCQEAMVEFHSDIQRDHFPEITFEIDNIGSRPATNARIDIQVKGDFGITLPLADLKARPLYRRKLPPLPPAHPKPVLFGGFSQEREWPAIRGPLLPMLNPTPPRRDKEVFYYYDTPKDDTPVNSISLTCDLWRHAMAPQAFTVRIVPSITYIEVTGEVICTVHADNLTKPEVFKLVVTLSPEHQSALSLAREWFTSRPKSDK